MAKKEETIVINTEANNEISTTNGAINVISPETQKALDKVNEPQVIMEEQPTIVNAPSKNVKIVPNQNHKCFIGGKWYVLKKGVQKNVPENVKHILMEAGILSPM